MDSIEKVSRPMGVVGGGQLHTWIIESRHTTRTNPFACTPRKALVNVLPPGQDPLETVLSLQPIGNRMAVSINSKESAELIKDIQQPEGKIAVAPGPHPTLTSWIIFTPTSRDQVEALEAKWHPRENFSMMPLHVQQGKLTGAEVVAKVYLGKNHRNHQSVTHFWSVLNFHVQKIMDQLQDRPYLQYEGTNEIRLAFKHKKDAQTFITSALPTLKQLGYSFKTEGTKDDFWDRDGDASSSSSVRTNKSWSTAGSKAPGEGDTIVLVDLPEFLSPDELLQVVKEAMRKNQVPTDNAVITLEKLRWNMGNLRKPNWLVKAPGISKLKGMVLTLQQEDGTKQIATARSKGEWEKARADWQARPKKPNAPPPQVQAGAAPQSAPQSSLLPAHHVPNQHVSVPPVLPNILNNGMAVPPIYQQGHLNANMLSYLQALLTQSQSQSSGSSSRPSDASEQRMMALDITSVRSKRPLSQNESSPF